MDSCIDLYFSSRSPNFNSIFGCVRINRSRLFNFIPIDSTSSSFYLNDSKSKSLFRIYYIASDSWSFVWKICNYSTLWVIYACWLYNLKLSLMILDINTRTHHVIISSTLPLPVLIKIEIDPNDLWIYIHID